MKMKGFVIGLVALAIMVMCVSDASAARRGARGRGVVGARRGLVRARGALIGSGTSTGRAGLLGLRGRRVFLRRRATVVAPVVTAVTQVVPTVSTVVARRLFFRRATLIVPQSQSTVLVETAPRLAVQTAAYGGLTSGVGTAVDLAPVLKAIEAVGARVEATNARLDKLEAAPEPVPAPKK